MCRHRWADYRADPLHTVLDSIVRDDATTTWTEHARVEEDDAKRDHAPPSKDPPEQQRNEDKERNDDENEDTDDDDHPVVWNAVFPDDLDPATNPNARGDNRNGVETRTECRRNNDNDDACVENDEKNENNNNNKDDTDDGVTKNDEDWGFGDFVSAAQEEEHAANHFGGPAMNKCNVEEDCDDENEDAFALMRQADQWLLKQQQESKQNSLALPLEKDENDATNSSVVFVSPTATTASSSASSVATPDLVQWTDHVLSQSMVRHHPKDRCNDAVSNLAENAISDHDCEGVRPQILQFQMESHNDINDDDCQVMAVETDDSLDKGDGSEQDTTNTRQNTASDQQRCHAVEDDTEPAARTTQQSEMCAVPLSLRLPVDDLSTLEARFVRRRQQRHRSKMERTKNARYNVDPGSPSKTRSKSPSKTFDLPSYYFTSPNLDDTSSLLASLPWQYVFSTHDLNSQGSHQDSVDGNDVGTSLDLVLWDEITTAQLCDFDDALQKVQKDILFKIQPHEPTLQRANEHIHDCEQNLRLAFMYWERSNASIEAAAGFGSDGLAGPNIILHTCQQREDYKVLSSLLHELDDVWGRERDLLKRIDNFDVKHGSALDEYHAVMQLANSLEEVVTRGRLANLQTLNDLRERLAMIGQRFWSRLLEIARSVVIRSCRQISMFDRLEYERLVRAFLDLRSQASVEKSINVDFPTSWTENILTVMSYETDRALALALLQPNSSTVSTFNQELNLLSREVDVVWGDGVKLKSIAHNLVTIRFDLESNINHLPRVVHRLCYLMTEILRAHSLLIEWHRENFELSNSIDVEIHERPSTEQPSGHNDLKEIYVSLNGSAVSLWNQCESVLNKCLDEYLHFAKKRSLFERTPDGLDDRLWRNDLKDLSDVWTFVSSFLSMEFSFLGTDRPKIDDKCGPGAVLEKLSDVFRRHLRNVHVDAMNTIGRRLSNESWILGSFSLPAEPERTELPATTVENLLQGALTQAFKRITRVRTKSKDNDSMRRREAGRLQFKRFPNDGNPFRHYDDVIDSFTLESPIQQVEDAPTAHNAVYFAMNSMIAESEAYVRLAPDAVTQELIVWFARLVVVMENLPLITDDVSAVFANICDLYFTTVFRLCTGSTKSERLILGIEAPSPLLYAREELPLGRNSNENSTGAQRFSSFRKQQSRSLPMKLLNRPRTILPSYLEAEICSPLLRDTGSIERLRTFIERGQKSLAGVVSLDMVDSWIVDSRADTIEEQACELARLLAKRLGAIWSCLSVAALVDVVLQRARLRLDSNCENVLGVGKHLNTMNGYCQTVFDVVPSLVKVASRIACTRAVAGPQVVKEILTVGSKWEECKLHEYSNDYVEDLSYRCALIWGYMSASPKLPLSVMKDTWENIVSSSYRSLLDGYSRVQYCSTEGRSLMALDLATFAAGITPGSVSERLENIVLVNSPPSVNPECDHRYVESFLKVSYYPREDAIQWITENLANYKMNHSLSLMIAVVASDPEQGLAEALENVKALYNACSEAAAEGA